MSEGVFDELADAVLNFNGEKAVEYSKKALSKGISVVEIIEKGLAKGLRDAGKKFENGEFFLAELASAAEVAKKAIREVLEPELAKRGEKMQALGRVVIGTVAGDIHDIGKNLVAIMLTVAGFEVYDLGVDVPAEEFVKKAQEVNANLVAASALLTTTMPMQMGLIEALKKAGIRQRVKVMVGGAPVTRDWAEQIGADGYASDAIEAVEVAKRLLGIT